MKNLKNTQILRQKNTISSSKKMNNIHKTTIKIEIRALPDTKIKEEGSEGTEIIIDNNIIKNKTMKSKGKK